MGLLQDLENIRADRMRIGMQSVAESVRTGSAVHSVKVFITISLTSPSYPPPPPFSLLAQQCLFVGNSNDKKILS